MSRKYAQKIHGMSVLAAGLTICGSLTMMAQSSATLSPNSGVLSSERSGAAQQTLIYEVDAGGHGCPVSMYAEQRGMGDLMRARKGEDQAIGPVGQARQRIRLRLKDTDDGRSVVSAKVLVKGTSAKGRALNAMATNTDSGDKLKSLEVHFTAAGEGVSTASLTLDGFTSVGTISLRSITYADGSSWLAFEGSSCRTIPDPLVLVENEVR